MAKGLNQSQVYVDLVFQADAKQARQELQQLQQQMLNLTSPGKNTLGLKVNGIEDFAKAGQKIAELTTTLDLAKDKMGNLDLTKLSQSLKSNNTNLTSYAKTLSRLGPEGEQAFVQLARGVNQAGASMKKSYGILTEFKNTLMNTARWQISSSILHGFMGAVQKAYGYAQDLNKSLNNIRIVTGQNIDQMSRFADRANKAAKALSTTTTEYTNASLIYYQQGLNDSEVKERTDITIKMANAAGQSAEVVSDQMTAVWNNFDDGSKSLEYYADVMTALGAATASSTDEIAAGLEKFSAVAGTVGLSYEYATSALATVTAETRQSADVVGTAFKTLFARIEGLSLGDTLEDGTDLNKYSAALAKVGVNIKDASGELKSMDNILNELGQRWQTLAKDEQVALAQTVAGVRQYNQLISLMDNWDTFQDNLETAYTSEGSLQAQADIYAESWEAARDRVTASMETIYQQLLDDKFFIAITDGFGKFLDTLSNVIDTLGGLPGVLSLVSGLLFKIFGNNMANAMSTFAFNLRSQKKSFEEMMALRKDANKGVRTMLGDSTSQADQSQNTALNLEFDLYDRIIEKKRHLKSLGIEITDEEQKLLDVLMKQQEEYTESAIASGKRVDEAARNAQSKKNTLYEEIERRNQANAASGGSKQYGKRSREKDIGILQSTSQDLGLMESIKSSSAEFSDITKLQKHLELINQGLDKNTAAGKKFSKIIAQIGKEGGLNSVPEVLEAMQKEINETSSVADSVMDTIREGLARIDIQGEQAEEVIRGLKESFYSEGQETFGMVQDLALAEEKAEQTKGTIDGIKGPPPTAAQGFTVLAQGISNVSMIATSFYGLFQTWNNEDMSFGEKLISTFTTLGMVIPMVTTAFNKNSLAQLSALSAGIANAIGQKGVTLAYNAETGAIVTSTGATVGFGAALWTVLWPIGLVIAAIGALVAVVALLVKAYNADADAAKSAQEQVNNLTTQYQECKTAAEELKSTISDWEDGVEALEKLDKSTDEYKVKLEELNAQARELIETYGLYDQYSIKGGLITFDDNVLKDLQDKKDKQANDVETQLNAAKIISNNANIKSQGTDLGRSFKKMKVDSDEIWDDKRHMGSSEVQQFAKAINDYEIKYNKDKGAEVGSAEYVKLSAEQISTALKNSAIEGLPDILNDNLSRLTGDDIQSIIDFKDSMNEATEANKYYAEQIARNEVENKYRGIYEAAATDANGNVDHQMVESMIAAGATYASEHTTDSSGKTLEENLNNIDVSGAISNSAMSAYGYEIKDDKDLAKTYATEVLGWDENQVSYESGSGKGTITNAVTGEEMSLEDDVMRKALARESKVDSVTEAFNTDMESTMKSFNDAMTSVVQGASSDEIANIVLGAASTEDKTIDYNSLVHQLSPEDILEINEGGTTSQEVMEKLGLKEEDLKAMGLANGEEFLLGFGEAMADYSAEEFYENMSNQARTEATTQATQEGFGEEDSEDLGEYATHLMDIAEESDELADSLKGDAETAAKLSVQIGKMNRGVETLADNFDEWGDVLKNSSKESLEYSKAMKGTQKALADVLDVEEEYISDDFVKEHLEDIEKAAEGDAEAIDRLGQALSKQIVLDIAGVDDVESLPQKMQDALDNMQTAVDNASFDIGEKVELDVDDTGFIDACQGIVDAAGMSVDEAQAYFDSLGYTPEFEMTNVTETAPMYGKRTFTDDVVMGKAEDGTPYIKEMTTREEQVYMGEQEQNFVVPALNPDGTPKIRSVTKKAGGSFNNSSSSNKGGKSSGGGGGSKSKPAEDVKKTKKSDVVERYKEINDALDDMADAIDKASGKADRLYGAARVKAMKEQAKLMRQEVELLKKKRKEAQKNLDLDKKALEKTADGMGIDLSFDKEGNITNYTQEMEKLYKELNAAETKMDGMATKEAQDEYKESVIKDIEDRIELLKDVMGQYEETRELIEDLDKDIREKEWATEDLEFETFEYEIEVKVEVDTRELEYLEYLLGKIDDYAFKSAKRLSLLFKQQAPIMSQIQTTTDAMAQTLKDNGLSKEEIKLFKQGKADQIDFSKYAENFTPEEIEFLKNSADELLAYNEQLMELQDNIHNEVNVAYDEWNEKLERQISLYDHYNTIIDNIATLTELAGSYAPPGMKSMLADAKVASAQGRLGMAQSNYDAQKASLDEARKKLEEAEKNGVESDIERWKKTVEEMEDKVIESEEELYAAAIAAAEAAQEQFNTAVEESIEEYKRSLSANGKSLDAIAETMERQKTINEQYLNDYQKAYEITKLTRDISKSIDETDNLKAKQALRDIQEEINEYQKEGNEMSRYDIDYLQKKYELRLAEIALEEAQNAKSQVRMSRDAEGNWGYVYTADEDKVAEAEQNYADKLYEMQEMSNNYANEMSQSLIQTEQEFADTMAQIQQNWQEGRYSSYEEYQQAMDDATAYYTERINYFSSELDGVTQNNKELYENDWSRFEEITGYKIGKEEDFQTSISNTLLGMATGYTNAQQPMDDFAAAVGDPEAGTGMLGTINTAFNTWKTNTEGALGAVGLSMEDLAGTVGTQIGTYGEGGKGILGDMYNLADQFSTDAEAMQGDMQALMDKVSAWQIAHSKELEEIIRKNELVVDSFNKLNDALVNPEDTGDGDDEDNNTPEPTETPTETPTTKEIKKGGKINAGSAKIYDYKGDTSGEGQYFSSDPVYKVLKTDGDWIKVRHHTLKKGTTGWFKKGDVTALDTGGYTGQWGAEGKLAFLHQKELVLNPGETENFLLAMNVLREIVKGVTLTSMFNDSLYSVSPGINDFNNKLEQEVTIHAEFPNVTDHNEIEEALNNLVNTASQYANRKK